MKMDLLEMIRRARVAGEKLKKLLVSFKKPMRLALIVLACLFLFTWFAFRPTGALVLGMVEPLRDKRGELYQHFAIATARMLDIATYQAALSFSLEEPIAKNSEKDPLWFAPDLRRGSRALGALSVGQDVLKPLKPGDVAELGVNVDVNAQVMQLTGQSGINQTRTTFY